ncbi:fibronectin type III domain-containing protein [Candidatus Dojkabacteria bacterium]|nr:fibronectin type III domain-containing protein [Candidatus Dojkabacteria bacterium]
MDIENIQVTNVTETGVTYMWYTKEKTTGRLLVKEGGGRKVGTFYDDRDVEQDTETGEYKIKEEGLQKRHIHHVSVTGLEPEKEYEVLVAGRILSKDTDAEGNKLPQIKTLIVNEDLETPDPMYGKIIDEEGNGKGDIYVEATLFKYGNNEEEIEESGKLSTYTNKEGGWTLDVTSFRNQQGIKYTVKADTVLRLETSNEEQVRYRNKFKLENYKPLVNIIFEDIVGDEDEKTSSPNTRILNENSMSLITQVSAQTQVQCQFANPVQCTCPADSNYYGCVSWDNWGRFVELGGSCNSGRAEGLVECPGIGGNPIQPIPQEQEAQTPPPAPEIQPDNVQEAGPSGYECKKGCENDTQCLGGTKCHSCGVGRSYCVGITVTGYGACEENACGYSPSGNYSGDDDYDMAAMTKEEQEEFVRIQIQAIGEDQFVEITGIPLHRTDDQKGLVEDYAYVPSSTCEGHNDGRWGVTCGCNGGTGTNYCDNGQVVCLDDRNTCVEGIGANSRCSIAIVNKCSEVGGNLNSNCDCLGVGDNTIERSCITRNGEVFIVADGRSCPRTSTDITEAYNREDIRVGNDTVEVVKAVVPVDHYEGKEQNAYAAALEFNDNIEGLRPGDEYSWIDDVSLGADYPYVNTQAHGFGAGACMALVTLDQALVTSYIETADGRRIPLISFESGDRRVHGTPSATYGINGDPDEGATFFIDYANPANTTNYSFTVNPQLAELGIDTIDIQYIFPEGAIDEFGNVDVGNFQIGVQIVVNGLPNGAALQQWDIQNADQFNQIVHSLNGNTRVFADNYTPSANDVLGLFISPVRAQDENVEDKGDYAGTEEVPAKDTDTKLEIVESGVYEITDKGSTYEKVFIVEGDSATVKFFDDVNKNGQKDPVEPFQEDIQNITLEKVDEAQGFSLVDGWNLIDLELVNEEVKMAGDLMDSWLEQGANIKHIAKYEGGQWIIFSVREGDVEFSNDFNLIPGQGLFVLSYGQHDVAYTGKKIDDNVEIGIGNGWNLVGIISKDKDYTGESLLREMSNQGIEADVVSKYEGGLYTSVVLEDELLYGNDYNIVDGRGYFIRVQNGGGSDVKFTPSPD